jgi:hypothetical protein
LMHTATSEAAGKLSDKKGRYVEEVARNAVKDSTLLKLVLEGILSTSDAYRYNCFKVLSIIGEQEPDHLYPEWKRFELLLRSKNSYQRGIAVNIIAKLTRADKKRRFEKIFNYYFGLIDDESLMVARYVARNAGKIARSKPRLRNKIISELLKQEKETHFDQGRKDLIAADALQFFEEYFEASADKEKIIALARTLEHSKSPKAKKTAKLFLERHYARQPAT